MYIITNVTATGEYTPSQADTLEEAKEWLLHCTAENIRKSAYGNNVTKKGLVSGLSDEEVIKWASKYLSKDIFEFNENYSYIEYMDESFNRMTIYKM